MIHLAAMLTTVEAHRAAAARPAVHAVVRRGDSLSAIAKKYRIQWPGLYEANKATIGADPNLLNAGERLRIPSRATAAHLATLYHPPVAVVTVPAPVTESQAESGTTEPVASTETSSAPAGSFQECVISRESGGDSQVMNSSGHYGLYQFSEGSWVAAGGSAADFGHASVAEQNQVFNSAYAADGASPWAPYDGC